MSNLRDLTHERLIGALHYEPGTGVWTSKKSGRVVGYIIKGSGKRNIPYNGVSVAKHQYLSSRLAWFYMTGHWPVFEIDHRNTDSLDDRWDNLRQATRNQNEANKSAYRNSRSGFKGVFIRSDGKICVAIRRGGKRVDLGRFPTVEAGAAAYAAAAKTVDGEFLRLT